MPYAPILRSIFVPFSAHMHISKALGYLPNTRTLYLPLATYSTTNISTSSRRKETLRCSLHQLLAKGGTLPICAHFHALLHSKSKLGSLGLSTYLGTYPSFYKLSLNSTMAATYAQVSPINKTQNCAHMPLRHFTEHLVGAPLSMKQMGNKGNVTCPIISEHNLGLRQIGRAHV